MFRLVKGNENLNKYYIGSLLRKPNNDYYNTKLSLSLKAEAVDSC